MAKRIIRRKLSAISRFFRKSKIDERRIRKRAIRITIARKREDIIIKSYLKKRITRKMANKI